MQKKPEGLLKKSELARLADVSSSTINYYVSEGLIPVAYKPNPNMAWYDRSCVERIKLIKKLQKEQYLPLPVIKRIISSNEISDEEIKLGLSISGLRRIEPEDGLCTKKELHERTGFPLKKIDRLTDEGILTPELRGRRKLYSEFDVKLTEIAAEHDRSGLPFEYTIRVFKIYLDSLRKAVRKDTKIFISMVIPSEASASKEIYFMDEMDDNLNKYIMLMRQKLTYQLTTRNMEDLNRLPGLLKETFLFPLPDAAVPATAQTPWRFYRDLFTGNFEGAKEETAGLDLPPDRIEGLGLFLSLWAGDDIPPAIASGASSIPATARALAVIISSGGYSGLIEPIQRVVDAVSPLIDMNIDIPPGDLIALLTAYTRGTILASLPEIMDLSDRGHKALEGVNECIDTPKWVDPAWPAWLKKAVRKSLFPAMREKISSLLSAG